MELSSQINIQSSAPVVYAGFWIRFLAMLIDGIIISFVQGIFLIPLIIIFGISGFFEDPEHVSEGALFAAIGSYIFFGLFFYLAIWLYYALMESSSYGATLGKLALGLRVTDMIGNRMSFGRASGRYFGKIVSGLILNIGYIIAAFTDKKQALHDIMAGCLVIRKI